MSLRIIVNVTPDNREYKLAPNSDDIIFPNPLLVDWGDGVSGSYNKLSAVKHKYKSIKQPTDIQITIHDPSMLHGITFKHDIYIKEVYGELTSRFLVQNFFKGCEQLVYVDPMFFKSARMQTDISGVFSGCLMYDSGTDPLECFDKIIIADNVFENTRLASSKLREFNFDIFSDTESMEYMLSDNYLTDVSFIPFESFKKVKSMKGMLSKNEIINSMLPVITNVDLVNLDEFIVNSPNVMVNKNWLYYLPSSVQTKFNNIFHRDVDVNGR